MTMIKKLTILFIMYMYPFTTSIWPPSYNVSFKNEEIFVISDITNDEGDDIYQDEDEMLKEDEVKAFNLDEDNTYYKKLHKISKYYNQKEFRYNNKIHPKPKESFNDVQEQPWEAALIRLDETNLKNNSNYKIREASVKNDYNYDDLKLEYTNNIKKEEQSKATLNYTETKEEESFKDALDAVVHPSRPNCTIEEQKGIGAAAIKCLVIDITDPNATKEKKSKLFQRMKKILLIWIAMYLIIAIPCWCQRGWCCCCCQCELCKPRRRIDRAKKYLLDNPPGTYRESDKEIIKYTPTYYEKYAHKNLEKALLSL